VRLVLLAALPLGWGQRIKAVTEEHHSMPSWPFHAATCTVGLQLVVWLGRSSCVSQRARWPTAADVQRARRAAVAVQLLGRV
jgi:hypothetical protein